MNLWILLVIAITLTGCEIRINSRNIANDDALKPDSKYTVDTSGSNINIYEFYPPSGDARCFIAESGQGIGLSCFPDQPKTMIEDNQ